MAPPHDDVEARKPVWQAANAFMQTQALHVATRLNVAEALAAGPLPAADLAAKVGAKEDYLCRILRFLATQCGIFEERSPGVFANNPSSAVLKRGLDGMWDFVVHLGDESYAAHHKMYESVVAGGSDVAFEVSSGGLDYWAWLNKPENHEASSRFNRAMAANSETQLAAILQEYDWTQHATATLADVGGSTGNVLAAVLDKHPGMRGIVFDRPAVIGEVCEAWDDAMCGDRVELVAGDFFVSVPKADVYFLKYILHDWNDADCVKILKTIRAACAPDARLLLCEIALPDGRPADFRSACLDLQMMVMCGSKERTESEWRQVMAGGGFELQQVLPLSCGQSMIVGRPV